ncbi:hypothetical protein AAE02nite_08820 [Adhaeribacter aerolatus]|uniref:Uncharacterized protein n=1 Tax=Adhaeribacter aerolatus TaxID=670289 RepID=A0A512AU32_9BACT|nr:hypothetical protein [Adhaeribacter aerolatus]GEO03218.1 hypothetical protein AAE02nite_08820 [Adhaeribacter aerolatus]
MHYEEVTLGGGIITAHDSGIAIIADDFYDTANSVTPFYQIACNGPVENMVIENKTFKNQLLSLRLLSSSSRVDKKIIKLFLRFSRGIK